jgi:two-component system, OmpR family, sensor histidine kinase CreC
VERYVTALTHELKSPLAAIRASGELLTEPMNDVDRKKFAGHVVDQSERMQRSVDRLLELTRLEQTQRLDDAKPHDVSAMVGDVVAALKPRADAARVTMDVLPATTPIAVSMDRDLMKLAVSNVLENAIAFSGVDSRIAVSATITADRRYAEVTVQDAGPGVDATVLAKVGERFVSTPRPNGAPKSSGLGLAIVKQIMELHHGELLLMNADGGARAQLRVPLD